MWVLDVIPISVPQLALQLFTVFGPHRYNRRPWDEPPPAKSKSSWLKTYIRLCNAFVCSALFHVCGDLPTQIILWKQYLSTGGHFGKASGPLIVGMSGPFFLLQPLGILVEDAVIEVGKRLGVKTSTWTKMIGYAWVWVWISITIVSQMDGLRIALITAFPGHKPGGDITVIERIADAVFGIDLVTMMRAWIVG